VLTGAVKVNPWNTKAVVEAMHDVMTWDDTEQSQAFEMDHSYVSTQRFDGWVDHNLLELKAASAGTHRQSLSGTDSIEGIPKRIIQAYEYRALNFDAVARDYRGAKGIRLFFFGNEGTLAPDRRSVLRYGVNAGLTRTATTVDPDTIECLRNLAADQKNIVVVISGREQHVLKQNYGDIDKLGLMAEHGFFWTLPGRLNQSSHQASGFHRQVSSQDKAWHSINETSKEGLREDNDWKTVVVELFKQYTKRVQGSIVERMGSTVVWDYREVGAQDLAQHLALELARLVDPNEPNGLMNGYPVMVVSGQGFVEVKRRDVNKGLAVQRIYQMIKNQLGMKVDFALCIGDDRSDETMFESIHSLQEMESGAGGPMSGVSTQVRSALSGSLSNPGSNSSLPLSEPLSPLARKTSSGLFARGRAPSTAEEHSTQDCQLFYTAKVGRTQSVSKFFVKDIDDVQCLLKKLSKEGIRTKFSNFSSSPDLMQLMVQESAKMEPVDEDGPMQMGPVYETSDNESQ